MAQLPSTTVVPFGSLPPCANDCGVLYDANGACVPPIQPEVNLNCFCNYAPLVPFSSQANGPCDAACTATPSDVTKIQTWFQSFCASAAAATQTVAGSTGARGAGGGGDWLSTHWKWVIMLVILVVGIAGIWIGACIWRRRYLRKKDRNYALGGGGPVGPGAGSAVNVPGAGGAHHQGHGRPNPRSTTNLTGMPRHLQPQRQQKNKAAPAGQLQEHGDGQGMFMPAKAAAAAAMTQSEKSKQEKAKEKKKWVVKERT